MPPAANLPVFIATSIVLLAIPGPAVVFIVARSGAQGTRAGLVSVLGIHAATVVHVLAAIAGLSAIIVASAAAFAVVRVAGGAYLIVLGVTAIRHARKPTAEITAPIHRRHPRLFAEGFAVELLNPKVALFFLTFLPQFVARHHGPIWSQTLALGAIYIALGLVSDSIYAIVGARAGRWISGRRAGLRSGRYAEGGLLIGLGVVALALPHRRVAK